MGLFGKIMGLFGKKKTSKVAGTGFASTREPDMEDEYNKMMRELGLEELMQSAIQMDLEFNASVVQCKKCGNKFTMNAGWQLFRGMAKENVIYDPSYASTLMCGDCFSIFAYRHDYEHKKIELTRDLTQEKEKLLQEKYL